MKPTQNNKTAIQRIMSFNQTMSIMEGITNQTVSEQKSLMEGIADAPDYNGGVFDMDKILDVDAGDSKFEPQLYNAPVEELDADDKRLIVSEFAKELAKISDEVIDFGKIGAVATVIQSKFGFKQNLESFINELISGSATKQDSVAMAHGGSAEEVGEIADAQTGGEGSPTDIAPEKVDVGDDESEIPMGIEGLGDVTDELDSIPDMDMDETVEPMDVDSMVDDESFEDISEPEETEETPEEEALEHSDEAVEGEMEDDDENLPVVTESIDAKLYAIKGKYIAHMESAKNSKLNMIAEALEERKIDVQLESIKSNLHNKKSETKIKMITEAIQERKLDAQLEAIKSKLKAKKVDVKKTVEVETAGMKKAVAKAEKVIEKLPKQKNLKAKLESISGHYHAQENAKVADKTLTAKLESIATGYKSEITLDSKLKGLIESYQTSTKAPATQRQVIKDALKKI